MKRNYGWRCNVTTSDFEPFMGEKAAKFTAHAINNHDYLVDALANIIKASESGEDIDGPIDYARHVLDEEEFKRR